MTRIPPIVNSPEKVQLSHLSHVYLEHPDLDRFETFAGDFGFVEAARDGDNTYYRGFGKSPYCYVASKSKEGKRLFKGGAFAAQTREDFEKASKLPNAKPFNISKAPGGGEAVAIATPGGSTIYVIWGQELRQLEKPELDPHIKQFNYNTSFEKYRKGEFVRLNSSPAMIHKLGHYGFVSDVFDQDVAFYTGFFNLSPSDAVHAPGNEDLDVLVFLHLDLGDEYSDHHSVFFQRGPPGQKAAMHHCSFEVEDFDTQLIGHEYLISKGYRNLWGVGRHVLGSQIFDYWKDPNGFNIEHYADGDVVNKHTPVGHHENGPNTLSVWGPPVPADFGDTS
jgi:Glyoxalase/Bleomycin resistance protein/Dioxygenase superfamily